MKILLTGSTGMVGKNLLEHSSVSFYEFLTPPKEELNLLNKTQLHTYLEKNNPDMVIHAAGQVGGIKVNMNNPVKFFYENAQMALNVLLVSRELEIKKLLNFGSSCIYPKDAENPLREEFLLKGDLEPTNEGFALAKLSAIKLCEYINYENQDYLYKSIIPCNLYGRFDTFDLEDSHMIPSVIKKISEAKDKKNSNINVWGDGLARREYMYAGDLADFVFYAIENFKDLPNIINVGSGVDHTINEYYQEISKALNFKCNLNHDLSKPKGIEQKLISNSKLKEFGWKPKTTLREGLKEAYNFYKSQEK